MINCVTNHNNNACMENVREQGNDESGFTILEVLVSFAILLMVVMMVPSILRLAQINNEIPSYEIDVFIQQASVDIRKSKELRIENDLELLMPNGDIVMIEQYKDMIRRRVNESGHEVFLQNVKQVSYRLENRGVTLFITDLDGNVYASRISLAPLEWTDSL
jgi:competence protein ComGF